MVNKNSFNYDFKLKNMQKTKSAHKGRINKISKSGMRYNDIVDRNFEDELLSKIYNSNYFQYWFGRKPQKITKTVVRQLKSSVNGHTRQMIRASLKYEGFPESWDTAFYLRYKTRVDAMMKRVTKQLLTYIPKK